MKNATLSNALRYSLFVQIALVMTGLFLYCLPNNVGQNFVVLLAPFVAGAPVAGSILQFLPNSNFVTSLPVMMGLVFRAEIARRNFEDAAFDYDLILQTGSELHTFMRNSERQLISVWKSNFPVSAIHSTLSCIR
jgi:hypothetical protein